MDQVYFGGFMSLRTYQFRNKKNSVLVFGVIIYEKIKSLMNGRQCWDSNQKRHGQWRDR